MFPTTQLFDQLDVILLFHNCRADKENSTAAIDTPKANPSDSDTANVEPSDSLDPPYVT